MMNMNWIILILAGLCEVGFTYCLGRSKAVAGYEWWTWIAGFAALYFVFREPATFWRLFFLTTLIASIVGLKTIS
jgi:quaternary ammonium compound-resistance protein SugE